MWGHKYYQNLLFMYSYMTWHQLDSPSTPFPLLSSGTNVYKITKSVKLMETFATKHIESLKKRVQARVDFSVLFLA